MAYKVVKYRLETDGTIPTWLTVGGRYITPDNSKSSPQDWVMIGISNDNVEIPTDSKVGEIASKDDLITYLTSISDGWTQPASDGSEEEFVPTTAAEIIWNELDTLNG